MKLADQLWVGTEVRFESVKKYVLRKLLIRQNRGSDRVKIFFLGMLELETRRSTKGRSRGSFSNSKQVCAEKTFDNTKPELRSSQNILSGNART